jgi:tetratricopeptide (TPR) repeat protein
VAAAVVIVLGFMQVVSWGGHAIEVLPLQAARLIGLDSLAANEHLARICLDLKKYECVERSYKRLAFAGTPDGFLRLGKFQNSRLEYAAAAESFRQFFARGGRDLEASYGYARALGEIGRVDEASRYYDHVLAAKPDVLQITVVHNYVKALVDHGRLDQALKVISTIRRRGQSVSSFMDSEYKDIKQRLRART